jgi:hypothetical protein
MRAPFGHSAPTACGKLPFLLLVLAALACQSPPPPPVDPGPVGRMHQFSPERAWAHLEALTAIGPRASGTRGASKARYYIEGQLESFGISYETLPFDVEIGDGAAPLELKNVVGTIPGASEDLFVLVAPYDTRYVESFDFIGANDGGSGAALLLELARTLSLDPLPYTTLVVFLDGEAPLGRGSAEEQNVGLLGSTALAAAWKAQGIIPRIRLLAYFNQVGDADLKIARDLLSHRSYREAFWSAASHLGYTENFPPDEGYESPRAGHQPFREAGVSRVTAIIDTSFGGDVPPGVYAGTEDDTIARCSPDSLEAVGRVTLEALGNLSSRLAKIDRFSDAPLRPLPEPEQPSAPEAAPAPEPGAAPATAGGATSSGAPAPPDAVNAQPAAHRAGDEAESGPGAAAP